MRWLNRGATALIALVVVVGPPAAVTGWALTHRPWPRPTLVDLRNWLVDPPPEAAIWTIVAAGAALLWLVTTTLIVRTLARSTVQTWRRLRRLPLPTPAQATAGTLAGTALLGLPAITPTVVDTGPPPATGTDSGLAHPSHRLLISEPGMPRPAAGVDQPAGVDLPDGGWIPRQDAEQAAAMVGLYWLRRRQTYQPNSPHKPDVTPQLPAAALTATAQAGMPAAAHDGIGVLSLEQLPAGVIALSGPGAHAAARGLLVTMLMTNTTIGAPHAHVMITHRDLAALLDGSQPPSRVPGLHVSDSIDTTTDRPLTTISDRRPGSGRAAPTRVLRLTSQRPQPAQGRDGDTAFTTVVFDADTKADTFWHVDADGTVVAPPEPTAQRRLCVLTAQTAADLLSLISHAHGLTPDTGADIPNAPAEPEARPAETAVPPASAAARPVRLNVLGELRLAVDGQPVPVRRTAAWQILVLLAAHPEGVTGRHIITTIWPGPPPATITNRLYTTLSELRTHLKPYLHDHTLIVHRGHRYTLDPDLIDVDLWQLRAASRAATNAITTTDRHRAHRAVITHHHGELATGHTWPWLAPQRETIRDQVVNAYADLVDGLPAGQAIELLSEAITVDPYNEDLHRRAITTLIDVGDHAAAARLRDIYLHRLAAAGLQPSTDVHDLAHRIAPLQER
jgi:DNA-binding SARP family transcriptional activator